MLKQTKHEGFTLIECLVATSILVILTTIAVPFFRQLKNHRHQLQVIYQPQAAVLMAPHLSIVEQSTVLVCPARAAMTTDPSQSPVCDDDYAEGVALLSELAIGWRLRRIWRWSSMAIKVSAATKVDSWRLCSSILAATTVTR